MQLRRRHVPAGKLEQVRRISAFSHLSAPEEELLARSLDEVEVEAGHTLIEEGRRNQAFWAVLEGEVEIRSAGKQRRRLGAGSILGAMSMLDGRPATYTVVALTPIRALVAGPGQFRALAGIEPVALRLKAISAERMREDQLATLTS